MPMAFALPHPALINGLKPVANQSAAPMELNFSAKSYWNRLAREAQDKD